MEALNFMLRWRLLFMSKTTKVVIGIVGSIILFVGFILAIFTYLFSDIIREDIALSREDKAPIETKELHQKNPTSYTFDGNVEEIRKKIIPAIKYPDFESPFPFKPYENSRLTGYSDFYICEVKDDICLGTNDKEVEEIFKKEENKNDIYVASDGMPILSSTYHALGKPLQFKTDFHVHFESQENNKTKITISLIKPVVFKGKGGRGIHGARLKKEIPVDATTVEEYQLLRYIGFVLGEKGMPEVILPK